MVRCQCCSVVATKPGFVADAYVGDHDVGRAGLVECAGERGAVGDVYRVATAPETRTSRGWIFALEIEYRDARACVRQQACGGGADAIGSAGNYGNLTGEIETHQHKVYCFWKTMPMAGRQPEWHWKTN